MCVLVCVCLSVCVCVCVCVCVSDGGRVGKIQNFEEKLLNWGSIYQGKTNGAMYYFYEKYQTNIN